MIPFEQAVELIRSTARSFGTEEVVLEEAQGRVLAEDIIADRNYPPFNRAAMDGYALMYSDWLSGLRTYKIRETIYAGQQSAFNLLPGTCYKIMTGSSTPVSADMIIRREDSLEEGAEVTLSGTSVKQFQNIATEGVDARKGDVLLKAPFHINPQRIALMATVGKQRVRVMKLPCVAIITTGNEVVTDGGQLSAASIRNSNGPFLRAALRNWNITPSMQEHVPDDQKQLRTALEQAVQHDITFINGGVSAGDADFVPGILEELGVRKVFHKAGIKPGKPIWFGQTSSGGAVFGLPGNPLSCFTTFTIFGAEYLAACFGFDKLLVNRLSLLHSREKKSALTELFPVGINRQHGSMYPLSNKGSGDITASAMAEGIGIHPSHQNKLKAGELISFYPLQPFI